MSERYQGGLVPKLTSEDVLAFCESVAPGQALRLVKVEPGPDAEPDRCHANVEQALKQSIGGKRRSGWLVWYYPDAFIELIFHSVVELPNGEWLDVTPHRDRNKQVCFLPDASLDASYDPDKSIPGRRKALTADSDIAEFLSLKSQHEKIWCELDAYTGVSVSVEMQLDRLSLEAAKTFQRWQARYMSPTNVQRRREKAMKKKKK